MDLRAWTIDCATHRLFRSAREVGDLHLEGRSVMEERHCLGCGHSTPLGETPFWCDGRCEDCDPSILVHPDNLGPYDLARLIECGSPDGRESPGSKFLQEAMEAWWDQRDNYDDKDAMINEMANDAVPVGTHQMWSVLVDLTLYQNEIEQVWIDPLGNDAFRSHAEQLVYEAAYSLITVLEQQWNEANQTRKEM